MDQPDMEAIDVQASRANLLESVTAMLLTWHHWQDGWTSARIHVDPTCAGYRAPNRQWMTLAEVSAEVDAVELNRRCEQIDLCVDALPWQHRAAIHTHMRNLRADAQVWRIPDQPAWASESAYRAAVLALVPLLQERGMLDNDEEVAHHSSP